MSLRTFCTIFLLISACAFPFYFTLAIGLFAVVWFKNYYELIPLYFLHDVVYGVPLAHFYSFSYITTLIGILFVCASVVIRKTVFGADQPGKMYF
jgi:hypothetical protein